MNEINNLALLSTLIAATLSAGTPLLLAGLGLLVNERAGVVNLGAEGMMLLAAVAGFALALATGSDVLALAGGALAGALAALLFGVFAIYLNTNQYATGLALSLLGGGLSAFVGIDYVSRNLPRLPLFVQRSRAGRAVRAVGASPESAHALGLPVRRVRLAAVCFGGACCGLAGAYLSVIYTPMWVEGMVAGRGWIALALTPFATWRASRVVIGAYLFGGVTLLQFHLQSIGVEISSALLSMLPYLATILVLALISRNPAWIQRNMPASLGRPFTPGQ